MTQTPSENTMPDDLAACQTLIQEQAGVISEQACAINEQAGVLNEKTCLVETQSNTIDELHGKS